MCKFDEKAQTWDENPVHVERSQAIAEAMRKHVPLSKEMTAFEYGCGTGLLSFELQPDLGKITMADSSDGMLNVLEEKIKKHHATNLHPVKLDLTKDQLPDATYNLVYTQMTLHHIPDIEAILKSFHKMLDSGGYLCIADLDKEDGSFHGKDVTDVHRGFDRTILSEMMRKVGFSDISFTTAYHMEKETNGSTNTFPIFLTVAKKK
ncbi:MAG TPA: methyltransferase domain-containing protein [Balneolaceae bacterium]|nr:methyltransferase domain-containing protein [Balneolaceae bacterium]